MSAKDYKICPALFNAYIAKPSKRNPNMMTEDRRIITEGEILSLIDWWLDREADEGEHGMTFESHAREGMRIELSFIKKGGMIMNKQDKQLLLKDISARLPYGVKVAYLFWDERKGEEYIVPMAVYSVNADGYMELIGDVDEGGGHVEIDKYLMYLRPMSSMKEEEESEYHSLCYPEWCGGRYDYHNTRSSFEWLLEHHFDFRGMIEKGLAIEVNEDNNPYCNKTK